MCFSGIDLGAIAAANVHDSSIQNAVANLNNNSNSICLIAFSYVNGERLFDIRWLPLPPTEFRIYLASGGSGPDYWHLSQTSSSTYRFYSSLIGGTVYYNYKSDYILRLDLDTFASGVQVVNISNFYEETLAHSYGLTENVSGNHVLSDYSTWTPVSVDSDELYPLSIPVSGRTGTVQEVHGRSIEDFSQVDAQTGLISPVITSTLSEPLDIFGVLTAFWEDVILFFGSFWGLGSIV